MKINKNSLQARIKNIVSEKGVPSNVVLQDYFFDAFLKRLAKSKYKENFVFKGGFLLSSNLGINYRSTMDIDFLIRNIAFQKENVVDVFKEIIAINVGDLVTFEYIGISDIREDDQYGGFNVSILGKLENIKVMVSVDVATGDPITPSSVVYDYKCLFDEETIRFASYNYETIISEKLQTILARGTTNSRSKDFYDLYIIYKLRFDKVDKQQLSNAFINTCKHRGTVFSKDEAFKTTSSILESKMINERWISYTKKNSFARAIDFKDVIETVNKIIGIVL